MRVDLPTLGTPTINARVIRGRIPLLRSRSCFSFIASWVPFDILAITLSFRMFNEIAKIPCC